MLNTRNLTRRGTRSGRTRPGAVAGLMIGSVLLGGGMFLAGCSAGPSSGAASSVAMPAKAAGPAGGEAAAPSAVASAPRAAAQGNPGGQDAATTMRLSPASSIIYTAQLTVRAPDVSAAAAQGRFVLFNPVIVHREGEQLIREGCIAQRERLWFHVDGAFGATAMLSEQLAPRLAGIERADSIAFDFHKWLQIQYDAGCILVRDRELHRATFASSPSYLTRMPRGLASGQPWFTDLTIDLSRGFRALKVWFALKEFGALAIGEAMENNVRQARLLGDLIDADADFELLAPVQLNIACFRYRFRGCSEPELDRLNDELVVRLQESGEAVVSSTTVSGHRAIRVCILNHRTQDADLTATLAALKRIALAIPRQTV